MGGWCIWVAVVSGAAGSPGGSQRVAVLSALLGWKLSGMSVSRMRATYR